jgi:hypothetical protein
MSEENKYGTKKDGTPRAKPGRKLGFKLPKKTPVEETKEQQ